MVKTPISDFEKQLIAKIALHTTFLPGTGPKRFIRDAASGHIKQLSEKGRDYLAFIAHRFRRQYQLSAEELLWVTQRLEGATERSKAGDLR